MSNAENQAVECPYCPHTKQRGETGDGRSAESAVAQHVSQSQDHPQRTHNQALEDVNAYNSPNRVPPEGSKGSASDGDAEMADENPLLGHPDVPTENTPRCPDCRATMNPLREGDTVTGTFDGREITFDSDGNDYHCTDCGLVATGGGQTVREVTINE